MLVCKVGAERFASVVLIQNNSRMTGYPEIVYELLTIRPELRLSHPATRLSLLI